MSFATVINGMTIYGSLYSSLNANVLEITMILGAVALVLSPFFVLAFIGNYFDKRSRQRFKQRSRDLREFARTAGYEFFETGDASLLTHLSQFEVISIAMPITQRRRPRRSRPIQRVIYGQAASLKFAVFDFQYVVSNRNGTTWHRKSIVYLNDPELRLPSFRVCPVNFLTRPLPFTGPKQVDVSSNPEFQKSYMVVGEDERRIAQLFSKDLTSFFLDRTDPISLEADGKKVVLYTGELFEVDQYKSFIASSLRLIEILKSQDL